MAISDPDEILWEEICCPLCSNGDEDLLLAVPADPAETLYRLVRCRHCGMVYVNPRPQAALGASWQVARDETILASPLAAAWLWLERLVLSCYHGYPPPRTGRWEKLLAAVVRPWIGLRPASLMPLPYIGEGRMLELSSSPPGSRSLQHRGWNVVGRDGWTEPAGSLLPPRTPAGSLDAIVLEGVLGQVHWPHPVIEQAARALRPGGLLAVWVPNLDSWGFRMFGMKWYPLDVPRRLLHFTPATLRRLITMHGLEVSEVRYQGSARWMRRSMQNHFYPGLFAGPLTRWTVWRQQADSLLLLARRPAPAPSVRLAA